ncbi:anti-anti-sigma factor [Duganella sp. SG902]|uniref:STAS domain-containing protein n=1 Tax=Duganella sp. SG902 TaxID=2587016 RepID=UPI00159D0CE6|nr:STAS domain-containing protein [Duganella sp. SG902]NVM75823.1 anti-anti-sigma factor [Duganella sp. SG902]
MSQPTPGASAVTLAVPASEITIFTAAQDRAWWLDAARAGPAVVIDLAAVERVDSAGMQLMLAAKRHARALGNELRFVRHGARLREVLALCGLTHELDAAPGREVAP